MEWHARRQQSSVAATRVARSAIALVTLLITTAALPAASHADACTAPVASAVACENTKPGEPPDQWQVGAGDATIQGFATSMSVNKGQAISFKIKSATSNYHIEILRLGYYGGDGARLIAANLIPTATPTQPACITQAGSGLVDCGNWTVSRTWTVPSTAVSGVYIARLVRDDTAGASLIVFVVRDDAAQSKVLLQTSDATWAAYNTYGGNSLYECAVSCPQGRPRAYKGASKVSYNKPFTTAGVEGPVLFYSEYPMIRFMEANGYDVSYISEVDVHQQASLLLDHKLFISSGHDEYWSNTQRTHVEAARDAGVSLAFFGGNDVFWKTRWEPSIDASNTADRTLVAYKDTHFDAPTDPVEWTGTWRDPRFSPPADGGRPENALMGQMFIVNAGTADITVPSAFKQLRAWRNTDVAGLASGESVTLAPTSLGYEWDVDFDNEFRPPGTFHLSSTTVDAFDVFTDYGSSTAPLTETHNLTMYRASSGARVFSAGTVNWSRGLDNYSNPSVPSNRNMQQMTVNQFADMGAQAQTLIPGLVPASPSTDSTPPSSTITSPSGGALADGMIVTISGTAADAGGGVVAGVEVSTNGGFTWHLANGTTSWSYAWTVHGNPSTKLRTRAVDDSGNLETPSADVLVNVSCPCSIWGNATVPTPDPGDGNSVEVGVKFKSDRFGTISGIRFYKASTNTGTHSGSLWTASGQRLAQATFTSESASGWQSVTFASPVVIMPDATYVASYYAPSGHYAATSNYMTRSPAAPTVVGGLNSPPLHALLDSTASPNGVFAYGTGSTFPTMSFRASNYWVDVIFSPSPAPGQVTNVTATSDVGAARVSWSAPSTGGPVSGYTITPFVGVDAQSPVTVAGLPPATSKTVSGLTAGSTYTFRVKASNPNGAGPESAASNAVTPAQVTAPAAPAGVTAEAASQSSIDVSWTEPLSDGGRPITSYTVTPYIGSTPQTTRSVSPPSTSTTFTGLDTGTQYTFRVSATNSVGTGPQSTPSAAVAPYSTIFDLGTPSVTDSGDSNAVEVGVKFSADVPGTVYGLRFYKSAANTGTHVGSLWTTSGQRLAQATFTNESSSGWQTVTFATPIAVSANTTYVASYFAPNGRYSYNANGFGSVGIDNGLLHAPSNASSAGNGVFSYAATGAFPTDSWNSTNYWVDVNFVRLSAPGPVTGASAIAGQASATVSWSAPSSGGAPTSYAVTPYIGASAQATTTVTGTPPSRTVTVPNLTADTLYTFRVQASNTGGAGAQSADSNSVSPTAPRVPTAPTNVDAEAATGSARVSWTTPSDDGGRAISGYVVTPYIGSTAQSPTNAGASATHATASGLANGSTYTFKVAAVNGVGTSPQSAASSPVTPFEMIFDLATPAIANGADANGVELGMKFSSTVDGSIQGIRFYKSPANDGTHIGSLWTTSGQRLAQATFTNESGSGWQTVVFAEPVPIDAGTTYVASYYASHGGYAITTNAFASGGVANGHLLGLSNSDSGGNGVFGYNATSSFPSLSFASSNYWVDVLFVELP
jgi:hypothetical protein